MAEKRKNQTLLYILTKKAKNLTAQTADVSIQHSVHPQRFCTKKMHFTDGGCWTSTCESKFTEHAATRLRERVSPSMLHHIHDATDCLLLNELNNDAYIDVEQIVKNTFPSCNISGILQVYAPQMYGMYMLRRKEMQSTIGRSVQEKLLFHVTSESRAMESLESRLDWRRTYLNKYGCGVSFSDDADYANYHANNSPREETRVIMICTVLVSETWNMKGNSLNVPPGRADTTIGNHDCVYVKYNDNDFYPLYFVYYRMRQEYINESKYFRAKKRRPKYLADIDYYDDDIYDDYSNELNDDYYCDDIYDDDYSNELNDNYYCEVIYDDYYCDDIYDDYYCDNIYNDYYNDLFDDYFCCDDIYNDYYEDYTLHLICYDENDNDDDNEDFCYDGIYDDYYGSDMND